MSSKGQVEVLRRLAYRDAVEQGQEYEAGSSMLQSGEYLSNTMSARAF